MQYVFQASSIQSCVMVKCTAFSFLAIRHLYPYLSIVRAEWNEHSVYEKVNSQYP